MASIVRSCDRSGSKLVAVVDMGSNGIRFSISNLEKSTARIMPTLYQHRVGISLYDAQWSPDGIRRPIDDATIEAVVLAFQDFKTTCADFGVESVHVLATEATRTAINSEELQTRIKQSSGWEVKMLPKKIEGEIGAMGIASSLPEVIGFVMDLGGGSTQLSWVISRRDDPKVRMPESGAVSLPYGAAAMTRRLAEAENAGTVEDLRQEVKSALKKAYETLHMPEELATHVKKHGGLTLYLSGGGFRGWGYVLLSRHHVNPYPIPVINGFKATRHEFVDTEQVKHAAALTLQNEGDGIFRISDRRASQVPAVAFLINALAEVMPQVKEVRFCQGGIREGYLFSLMEESVQRQDPLEVATASFRNQPSSNRISQLLESALPQGSPDNLYDNLKASFDSATLGAFANLMYHHSTHSKDLQAISALRCTTSGILAAVHGMLHESRTILALLLSARWGGDVAPTDLTFKTQLERLVESPWTLWWINYLGAVAALIAAIYPAGVVGSTERIDLKSMWTKDEDAETVVRLNIALANPGAERLFEKELKTIEKVGKKKNWIGGKGGLGYKINLHLETKSS